MPDPDFLDPPTPRETAGELLSGAFAGAQDPLEAAVYLARHIADQQPLVVPIRPATRYSDRELAQLVEKLDRLDGTARYAAEEWLRWRGERSHAIHENRNRLRGLLWAINTLAHNTDDPRTETMLGLILHSLSEAWGWVPERVPEAFTKRSALADEMIRRWWG